MFAVRGSGDADLVMWQTSELPAFLILGGVGRLLAQIGLIKPEPFANNDAALIILQDRENLLKPISARGLGVSVVKRGDLAAFVLEDMDEEFDPFRYRYFP